MKLKINFQGDSITDAGRDRSNRNDIGPGYTNYVAQWIKPQYPDIEFEFLNTGLGGDKVHDLLARLPKDTYEFDPDIVSVLVGTNDITWHPEKPAVWMDDAYFEEGYRAVLEGIKQNTHAKIIVMEPFIVNNPNYLYCRNDLAKKLNIIRMLACEYADAYVPLDGIFTSATVRLKNPTLLSRDGIHPSDGGACIIASCYLDAFETVLKKIKDER